MRQTVLISISASLYVALGFIFQAISFGPVQVRIADALYPSIAVLGMPWLLGTFLGQLIFNGYGYATGLALGPLDLLSPFIFLIPKYAIKRFGLKAVPLHVLFIAVWIGLLLHKLFGLPTILAAATVGGGEAISEIALGVPVALALRKWGASLAEQARSKT